MCLKKRGDLLKYKVGVCGYFAEGIVDCGGQPVKTNFLFDELTNSFEIESLMKLDTKEWKNSKFRLANNILKMVFKSENIIILPAKNGIKVIGILTYIFTKIFFLKRKLHYVVIGGWLPKLLYENKNIVLCKILKSYKGIYVETKTMEHQLHLLGFTNIFLMKNFKKLDVQDNNFIIEDTFKFCFFSRVVYMKGIEDAINAIYKINSKYCREVCSLDIYGPISADYLGKISMIIDKNTVKYMGVIATSRSTQTIKEYDMQLFPTKYFTEGIPGSIIDSFYSSVPVLASKWESFEDVINEDYNGIGYKFDDFEELVFKMEWAINNRKKIFNMRENCKNTSLQYLPSNAIKVLLRNLK